MAIALDHVVLWVEDARRALEFYVNVVGLPAVRGEEFAAGRAPFPSVRVSETAILDLVPTAGAALASRFTGEQKPTAAGRPLNHVCLAMDPPDFDALRARLEAAGVATHRAGELNYGARGNARHFCYFQDPDGNVIEARHYG